MILLPLLVRLSRRTLRMLHSRLPVVNAIQLTPVLAAKENPNNNSNAEEELTDRSGGAKICRSEVSAFQAVANVDNGVHQVVGKIEYTPDKERHGRCLDLDIC